MSQERLLNDFQRDLIREIVVRNVYRTLLLPGGRYSGKTSGGMLGLMLHGERNPDPDMFGMVLGGTTLDNIRANCSPAVRFWAKQMGWGEVHWPRKAGEIQVGSQKWEIVGLKDSDGATRVQGRNFFGAYVDELSETLEDNFDMLYTSIRGHELVKLIAAWNPKEPGHWVQKLINNPENWYARVFHSTMEQNQFADKRSIEAFNKEGALRPHEYQRLVLGLPAQPEGLIFPMWTKVEHDPTWTMPCVAGVDFAESGTSAAEYIQSKGSDHRLTMEFYHDARNDGYLNPTELAKEIKKKAPGNLVRAYVDPAAPGLIQELRKIGVSAVAADNTKRGYDYTHKLLAEETVKVVAENCPGWVTEVGAYVYGKNSDKPAPSCVNHAMDAGRYVIPTLRYGNLTQNIRRT